MTKYVFSPLRSKVSQSNSVYLGRDLKFKFSSLREPRETQLFALHCCFFRHEKLKSVFGECYTRATNQIFPERINAFTC